MLTRKDILGPHGDHSISASRPFDLIDVALTWLTDSQVSDALEEGGAEGIDETTILCKRAFRAGMPSEHECSRVLRQSVKDDG